MIPHERSLVDEMKDKPFALIGINSDTCLDDVHAQAKEMGVTWRSLWCGDRGMYGAIPTRWNVTVWPTIYVLDQKGVIRYRNVRGEKMTESVKALLAEGAGGAAKGG
jgi:hypothetical protein